MKRPARPITAQYLQNAAAFYLERYPATAEGLRRVLRRRVRKAEIGEAPVMEALLVTCAGGASYSKLALFETCIPALRNAPQPARFVF